MKKITNSFAILISVFAWVLAMATDYIGIAWILLLGTWVFMYVTKQTKGIPFDWLFKKGE